MSGTIRTFGWLLILLATAALGWELYALAETGSFQLSSLGDLWHDLHPESLGSVQGKLEVYVTATLWNGVLAPVLLRDAVLVFALPGLLLASLPALVNAVNRRAEPEMA
jgi:hypothetical protein